MIYIGYKYIWGTLRNEEYVDKSLQIKRQKIEKIFR